MTILYIYFAYIILVSIITFAFYKTDKKRSKTDSKHRIPEKTLLLLSFFGGAIGGLTAMYGCRHKTKHWYFVVVNFLSLVLHIFLVYLIINSLS